MRPDRVVYLAFFVFTRFSRQGLAKEACTAVIEHLFRAYDAVEIRAEMDYRNIPSRCLVEALGFKRRTHNKPTTLRGRPALDYRYRLKRPFLSFAGPQSAAAAIRAVRRDHLTPPSSERRAHDDAVRPVPFDDPPARLHLVAQRAVSHVAMVRIGAIAEHPIDDRRPVRACPDDR